MTLKLRYGLQFVLAIAVFLLAFAVLAQGPTADDIKGILETPVALFVLMLLGSAGSILENAVDANKAGTPYTFSWAETLLMLGGNGAGFLVLLMSDQLNFAAVILGGYTANSLAGWSRSHEQPPSKGG
jgi:hypothetical protein